MVIKNYEKMSLKESIEKYNLQQGFEVLFNIVDKLNIQFKKIPSAYVRDAEGDCAFTKTIGGNILYLYYWSGGDGEIVLALDTQNLDYNIGRVICDNCPANNEEDDTLYWAIPYDCTVDEMNRFIKTTEDICDMLDKDN